MSLISWVRGVGVVTRVKVGVSSADFPAIFAVSSKRDGLSVAGCVRGVSTSVTLLGKRNFRKFHVGNKRGPKLYREARNQGKYPDIPVETEVRPIGFLYGEKYHIVPEMVPEFIVPDLTDFKLKPYVSYRAGDTHQEPFTADDLFQHVYFNKIDKDHQEGLLDENGISKSPSKEEEMTAEDAWRLARMTGTDIFSERIPRQWECLDINVRQWRMERNAKAGFGHFFDVLKEPYSPEMLLEENKIDEHDEKMAKSNQNDEIETTAKQSAIGNKS